MGSGRLVGCVIEFLRDRALIEHSLKVFGYAHGIGGEEGLSGNDLLILDAAALLHDIGIPQALQKHGSAAGPYQEAEGAALTPELLRRAGLPDEIATRVAWLVEHHHTEHLAAGDPTLQMLMEADYLVNLSEGNVRDRTPDEVLGAFFRTATGKRYMRDVFGRR